MDNFTKAEEANRPLAVKCFTKLCKTDSRFTGWEFKETRSNDKTRYDFWLEKDGKIILIEHKHRNYNKEAFSDWQLDYNKFTWLTNQVKDNIVGCYYINTFKNGVAIWNLLKAKGEKRLSKLHKLKTVINSGLVQTYDIFYKLKEASYVE